MCTPLLQKPQLSAECEKCKLKFALNVGPPKWLLKHQFTYGSETSHLSRIPVVQYRMDPCSRGSLLQMKKSREKNIKLIVDKDDHNHCCWNWLIHIKVDERDTCMIGLPFLHFLPIPNLIAWVASVRKGRGKPKPKPHPIKEPGTILFLAFLLLQPILNAVLSWGKGVAPKGNLWVVLHPPSFIRQTGWH